MIRAIAAQIIYSLVFLENDVEMISPEHSDTKGLVGASVRTVGALEDLVKVNNIFCDKTGTLTQNELIFKGLCCGPVQLFAETK